MREIGCEKERGGRLGCQWLQCSKRECVCRLGASDSVEGEWERERETDWATSGSSDVKRVCVCRLESAMVFYH